MFSKFLLVLLFLLLSLTGVMSQEYIVERVPAGDRSFVIEYERVDIKIKDQAARVTIEEKLKNNSSSDMEATLIFPMPADASISNFSMLINGKKVEGKIMDKDEAASIYESIVRQLKDPGLLENIGSGMFRARIYPIPARGETKISITYSQVLSSDLGLCKFKLPLAKKTSDWPVKELTIGVELSSSIPVKSFYSPTHNMSIKKDGDKSVKAGFEDTSYKGDKDFILYYGVSEEDFGLNLLTYKDRGDNQGFFLLIASPGQELDKTKILPKDIIFVIDTSGSMYDEDKITYAQKALKFCLSNLNGKDRFNVVTFNSVTDFYSNKLVEGTEENIKKAKTFVDTLKPLGGTNIDEAFHVSLKQFADEKRPHYIVFLTDGLPTQGETDTNVILKHISAENKTKVRIFSFGVGTDVNTLLLDLMAEQNQGYTSYLKAGEEMEVEISSFFTKISHPVLSDLSLNFGKIKIKDMYPRDLPDLFRGSQLILTGRYTDTG
ncbi:MAG: VIT and VWA domain-containing protein, partial [Candidatus Eremiobacterota bacterium]